MLRSRIHLSMILGAVALCLLGVLWAVYWHHCMLELRIAFAREQLQMFESMRVQAEGGDVDCAIGCLEYTMSYYPSGTKQIASSALDEMVEISRQHCVDTILSSLRRKTGKDYGTDPKVWRKAIGSP